MCFSTYMTPGSPDWVGAQRRDVSRSPASVPLAACQTMRCQRSCNAGVAVNLAWARSASRTEESCPQGIGDLKDGAYHAFSERVWASAFIGVHRRLIIMCPAHLIILRFYYAPTN